VLVAFAPEHAELDMRGIGRRFSDWVRTSWGGVRKQPLLLCRVAGRLKTYVARRLGIAGGC